jgi:hypothetical protein
MSFKKLLCFMVVGIALALGLAAPAAAQSGQATIHVAKPLADGTVTITFTANGVTQTVTVDIKGTDSVFDKQRKIKEALAAKGYTARSGSDRNGQFVWITNLPDGTTVTVDMGTTGEAKDGTSSPTAANGTISISGAFPVTGADGGPAVFTAGVLTGRGDVTVSYVAQDVPSDGVLPGSFIASQLAARLDCGLAELGVSAKLAGDQIQVVFDAAGEGERGIFFGTTAAAEGVSGSLGN